MLATTTPSPRTPRVWDQPGVRGEGVVVANIDTGVQYDHPALAASYRGRRTGGLVDHNYNWFDPSRICPTAAPCDNNGHGTHTMGTMVGRQGSDEIGVAPGATWMAVKGCESSSCSLSALLAAGQWILAPTDLAGRNPRPDLAPDVVNNSWGANVYDPWYQQIVEAWVAAGIFPAFANGNAGPGCGTSGSPGVYTASYSSGAFAPNDTIAYFSSRGPAPDGTVKPNIAAPGVDVRSSVPGNGYASLSGTSMASPHTAAVVALMWSAAPALDGDIPAHPPAPRSDRDRYGRHQLRRYGGRQQRVGPGQARRLRGRRCLAVAGDRRAHRQRHRPRAVSAAGRDRVGDRPHPPGDHHRRRRPVPLPPAGAGHVHPHRHQVRVRHGHQNRGGRRERHRHGRGEPATRAIGAVVRHRVLARAAGRRRNRHDR